MKRKHKDTAPLVPETAAQDPETAQSYAEQQDEILDTWQMAHAKELRSILLGDLVRFEDGTYGAGSAMWRTRFGFGDGALETLLFGITERWRLYDTSLRDHRKAVYHVGKLMEKVGKPLVLQTVPGTVAVYMKSVFFRPVILMFEDAPVEKGHRELVLHAYCGQSLFAALSIRRAIARFNAVLPKQIYPKRIENEQK